MRFLYYNAEVVEGFRNLPAMKRFGFFFRIYGHFNVMPIDRTDTIKFPVRTKSLFPMPKMRVFTKTYEELCNARAQELLKHTEKLDTLLYVFWSGGIDSTCVMASLLKNATPTQKKRIVVLMSEGSISENPRFYQDHIRGKLQRESATMFPYIIGSKNLILTGEHNDQIFGSDIIEEAIKLLGFDFIEQDYSRDLFIDFIESRMEDRDTAVFYVNLFERLREAAPVVLKTNFDVFWWINFATKWQSVYVRILGYTEKRNRGLLTEKYLQNYYMTFFNTEEFQLWSMNNMDKRIKDSWRSYKWPAKDIIYDFTGDADYRDNKIKRGSLIFLMLQRIPINFIDEKLVFREDVALDDFYDEKNDFT